MDRLSGQAEMGKSPAEEQTGATARDQATEERRTSSAEVEELTDQQAATEARREAAALASMLVRKGNKLRRSGRLRAAHEAYRHALDAFPHFPRALFGLTEVYLAQGNVEKALERMEALLEERRRFPDDQRLLGDVYMLAGRTNDALAAWRRAVRLGSSVARARLRQFPG